MAEVVPTMQDWLWPVSREVDVHPLRHFRASMQSAGLLRKYKGTLLLTKLGRQLRQDPVRLWTHLRDRLVPADPPFDETACLVLLLRAATTPAGRLHIGAIAETMGLLGWAHSGGQPVTEGDVWPVWNDLWVSLGNVGPGTAGQVADRTLSEAALSLVRDALLDEAPVLGVVR